MIFVSPVVKEIVADKKGKLWQEKYDRLVVQADLETGNQMLVWVFLLREWSELYGEKPHRIVYLEGEDSSAEVSQLPYVHVRNVSQPGGDFNRVIVSVMFGSTLIFEDIGLPGALAAVIEIYFSFNLCYDTQADSTLNFIQRIIAGFGSKEGSRNKLNKVKKSFNDFQAEFGRIMLEKKMGSVKTLFI